MQQGLEVVPTVNMNIYIQNYTNINNINVGDLDLKQFQKEKAKTEFKSRKVETPKEYSSSTKDSSPLALPEPYNFKVPQTLEEPQIKPVISRRKQSEIYETREEVFGDSNVTQTAGFCLIIFAALLFIGVLYAILISPLVGEANHAVFDMIQSDDYYCCLIPLMIPASFIFIYANWVSIKFFRHT